MFPLFNPESFRLSAPNSICLNLNLNVAFICSLSDFYSFPDPDLAFRWFILLVKIAYLILRSL